MNNLICARICNAAFRKQVFPKFANPHTPGGYSDSDSDFDSDSDSDSVVKCIAFGVLFAVLWCGLTVASPKQRNYSSLPQSLHLLKS